MNTSRHEQFPHTTIGPLSLVIQSKQTFMVLAPPAPTAPKAMHFSRGMLPLRRRCFCCRQPVVLPFSQWLAGLQRRRPHQRLRVGCFACGSKQSLPIWHVPLTPIKEST